MPRSHLTSANTGPLRCLSVLSHPQAAPATHDIEMSKPKATQVGSLAFLTRMGLAAFDNFPLKSELRAPRKVAYSDRLSDSARTVIR